MLTEGEGSCQVVKICLSRLNQAHKQHAKLRSEQLERAERRVLPKSLSTALCLLSLSHALTGGAAHPPATHAQAVLPTTCHALTGGAAHPPAVPDPCTPPSRPPTPAVPAPNGRSCGKWGQGGSKHHKPIRQQATNDEQQAAGSHSQAAAATSGCVGGGNHCTSKVPSLQDRLYCCWACCCTEADSVHKEPTLAADDAAGRFPRLHVRSMHEPYHRRWHMG